MGTRLKIPRYANKVTVILLLAKLFKLLLHGVKEREKLTGILDVAEK